MVNVSLLQLAAVVLRCESSDVCPILQCKIYLTLSHSTSAGSMNGGITNVS